MEITYYKPNRTDLKVESISLLTIEEVEQLPESIKRYDEYWWLKSPAIDSNYAVFVNDDGGISYHGRFVDDTDLAVRPVVTIRDLGDLNLEIGDTLIIQNEKYLYIGGNNALYNDKVVYYEFDRISNNYEESDIKKVVDNWFGERV